MVTAVGAVGTGIALALGWAMYLGLMWLAIWHRRRWWTLVPAGYVTIGVCFASYGLVALISDVSATEQALTFRLVADQLVIFALAVGVWPFFVLWGIIGD